MPARPLSENSTPKARRDLQPLKRLMPFLAPYKAVIAGAILALLIAGVTVLSIAGGLRYVIDRGFIAHNTAMLNHTLFLLLIAITVLAASTFARYTLVTWLGERVVADLRRAIYAHILNLSPAYFEVTRSGDILSRLSADTAILQSLIGSSISIALRNSVLLTGGIIMMLTTSPKLTGFVLAGIPLVIAPIVLFGRKVRGLSKANQERIADLNANAEETIYGIRTVQAFGHETLSRRTFDSQIEASVAAAARHIRLRGGLTALVIFMVFSAIGLILWVGGHDVLGGAITAGQLSAFVGYAAIAAGATGAISETLGDLQRASGATDRIFELLTVEPTITAPPRPVALPAPAGALRFENLSFHYPTRPDRPSLHDITFDIRPGERVAIVGPSGAGKTTLFQLALRFYDPQSGRVSLDGVNLRDADPQAVRASIGLVPQDPVIFSTDASQNIAYGRPDASDADIRAAAIAANANGFLSSLPQGYATHLGEKGVQLSGGQKQRIAIARAILRNPALLLLDEATSALDAESEKLVQDALDKLMVDRTTMIIAHRLATVTSCDRILVLDEGRIVGSGTHHSLIGEGGLYARLAQLQFRQTV